MTHYITGKGDGPLQLTITLVDPRETLIQDGIVDAVFATYSNTLSAAAAPR